MLRTSKKIAAVGLMVIAPNFVSASDSGVVSQFTSERYFASTPFVGTPCPKVGECPRRFGDEVEQALNEDYSLYNYENALNELNANKNSPIAFSGSWSIAGYVETSADINVTLEFPAVGSDTDLILQGVSETVHVLTTSGYGLTPCPRVGGGKYRACPRKVGSETEILELKWQMPSLYMYDN